MSVLGNDAAESSRTAEWPTPAEREAADRRWGIDGWEVHEGCPYAVEAGAERAMHSKGFHGHPVNRAARRYSWPCLRQPITMTCPCDIYDQLAVDNETGEVCRWSVLGDNR